MLRLLWERYKGGRLRCLVLVVRQGPETLAEALVSVTDLHERPLAKVELDRLHKELKSYLVPGRPVAEVLRNHRKAAFLRED